MLKCFKYFFYIFTTLTIFQNAHAFDLKALTDKIQKDIGGKVNTPNSGGSNPLGGLLKGLNQNNSSISTNTGNSNMSSSKGNTKLAKGICEPNIPQIVRNLPKGDVSLIEKDFGKNQNEIKKILTSIPISNNDTYVSSLKTFDGAFETKEIEIIFNNFLRTKSVNDLASLRAIANMDAGYSASKKQIKADAAFAYGLVHYYFRDFGSNKNLGINYIKTAAGTTSNIGALTVYGAWQFYGLNVKQNIQSGNSNALEGYNRADDKKRGLDIPQGKFEGLNPFPFAQKVFYAIADDNRNPYRSQYQANLQRAREMNKQVMAELARSEKYDQKSGWWPFIIDIQNDQHEILSALGDNLGLGEQLSELKAQYAVLASKVSQDNKLVERMVIINQAMNDRVQQALQSSKELDEQGKIQITNLSHDNEILIMKNHSFVFSLMGNIMAGGGFGGQGSSELFQMTGIAGGYKKVACEVYSGIKSYASRTKITLPEPVTTENTKTRHKFKKPRKS
jgi:hypothetical protein